MKPVHHRWYLKNRSPIWQLPLNGNKHALFMTGYRRNEWAALGNAIPAKDIIRCPHRQGWQELYRDCRSQNEFNGLNSDGRGFRFCYRWRGHGVYDESVIIELSSSGENIESGFPLKISTCSGKSLVIFRFRRLYIPQ